MTARFFHLVDSGNPMSGSIEVSPDSVTPLELGLDSFTGYSIVNVECSEEAIELAKSNSMITSVVVHELARM